MEQKDTPREKKCPAQEQYKLSVLYVSTMLLTSQYRPPLGLPGLDLEFEAYHLQRLVPRVLEMNQNKEGLMQAERSFNSF